MLAVTHLHNLHMFLDILMFWVENKFFFRENSSEIMVSEIQKNNLFHLQNLSKIVDAFMVYFLLFFPHFLLK